MRRFIFLLLAVVSLSTPSALLAQSTLYTVTQGDDQLRTVDLATGVTLSSTTITSAGNQVVGATGLAVDPTTGVLWAMLRFNNAGSNRALVTLDPSTGVATFVGSTGGAFAGIAFTNTGTLFGVTGDGEANLIPETLYTINKTNGSPTFFQTLGNGTDGEAIAFNPVDGLMYHASGHTGTGVIFETVNLSNNAVTNIPIDTPLTDEEAQALTWWADQNVFLWKQNHGTGPLFMVDTNGNATLIGDLDHQAKGLAIIAAVPEPSTVVLMLGTAAGAGGLYWRKRRQKTSTSFKRRS